MLHVALIEPEIPPNTGNIARLDRKSTRLNSSHLGSSYAVFCWKKKSTLVDIHFRQSARGGGGAVEDNFVELLPGFRSMVELVCADPCTSMLNVRQDTLRIHFTH